MTTQLELPLARLTDPDTSHRAARSVRPANEELIRRIRAYVRVHPCSTQYEIADALMKVEPGRWSEATIRTAVARAGLERASVNAVSPRGRVCSTWYLRVEDTSAL